MINYSKKTQEIASRGVIVYFEIQRAENIYVLELPEISEEFILVEKEYNWN